MTVLSFLLSLSMASGSVFIYLWVTNKDSQKMMKDKIMKEITSTISLPSLSGPALPTGALSPAQQTNERQRAIGLPKF